MPFWPVQLENSITWNKINILPTLIKIGYFLDDEQFDAQHCYPIQYDTYY